MICFVFACAFDFVVRMSCQFFCAQPSPCSSGNFDGQGSGHEFAGTNWHPSSGYVNNCDGNRSHLACDVRRSFVRSSFSVTSFFRDCSLCMKCMYFIFCNAICSTASSKLIASSHSGFLFFMLLVDFQPRMVDNTLPIHSDVNLVLYYMLKFFVLVSRTCKDERFSRMVVADQPRKMGFRGGTMIYSH